MVMKIWFALLSVGISSVCFGIVTGDVATSESNPTNKVAYQDFNWDYVYEYRRSTAVAVDSYWLLTAHHVADDTQYSSTLTINEETYTQQGDPVYHTEADLALVRYDKPFPGYYDLYNGDFPTPGPGNSPSGGEKLTGIMVGYGVTGTTYQTYYDYSWNNGSDGVKRWGDNKIDGTSTRSYTMPDTSITSNNDGIYMVFDTTTDSTMYEAGAATFDSGGGTFVNDNGIWKLAGINIAVYSNSDGPNETFAAAMPQYSGWINDTIPEPTIAILFGFSGIIWIVRRRFQKHIG